MSLRDGINRPQHVPVHKSAAWRCCCRTLVGPSVVEVHHLQKGAIVEDIDLCYTGLGVELERVEEAVDDLLFAPREVCGIVLHVKEDTNGGLANLIDSLGICWMVDSLHFKVVSITINSVLRTAMEMELSCVKRLWACVIGCLVILWANCFCESISGSATTEINLCGMTVESHLDILHVGIILDKFVILCINSGVGGEFC